MEDLHFPGQDLPEHKEDQVPPAPAPEAPASQETKPEETPPATPTPEPPAPTPEKPAEEVPVTKPRSIYKDLKETRQERNAWQDTAVAALKAQGIELTGTETPEEVQKLLTQHTTTPPAPVTPPAPAPSSQEPPADPIEAFAKEKGYDPAEIARLAQLIKEQIPQSQLSEEDRQSLKDLKDFKEKTDAEAKRREEDGAIQAEAPAVQKALSITDAGELTAVMAEIVRLAHTPRYADKEVDYIVFKEKEALSKLVSPKKPSFENGSIAPTPEAEPEVDLSKGGVTPEIAQKASQQRTRPQLEVRKAQ